MRLWMMEVIGDYESTREGGTSGLAAAVAIAVANGRYGNIDYRLMGR